MTGNQDRRRESRVHTRLPVDLGTMGVTSDVSLSGLYVETDAQYAVGSKVNPSMEIDTPAGTRMLRCRGKIVRMEHHDTKIGVAVKIISSTMELVALK